MDILDFPAAEICHLIHASSLKYTYFFSVLDNAFYKTFPQDSEIFIYSNQWSSKKNLDFFGIFVSGFLATTIYKNPKKSGFVFGFFLSGKNPTFLDKT